MPKTDEGQPVDDSAGDDSANASTPQSGAPAANEPPTPPAITPTGDADLDAKILAAVTAALKTQQEEADKKAKETAAKEAGNFQQLYEQSQAELHVLQLNKWRGEALKAAGLDDKWFDSVQGDTLESMTAFAKQFKKQLDEEVKAAGKQIVDEHPGTPRGAGREGRHREKAQATGKARVSRDLNAAFGVHRLPIAG